MERERDDKKVIRKYTHTHTYTHTQAEFMNKRRTMA